MHVPLHRIVKLLDRPCVLPDEKWRQVVLDHRPDCVAASAAGIRVSKSFGSITQV